MEDVELRAAALTDARSVADVLLRFRKAFLAYAPSPHSDVDVGEWVRHVLLPPGGVTVACAGGRVVGMLAERITPETAWITQLYVLPGCTGRGIGSRLLAAALQLPRPVRLYTFQANAGARAFYERHGFEAIAFSDGVNNEERCPDVLYELAPRAGGRDRPPSMA